MFQLGRHGIQGNKQSIHGAQISFLARDFSVNLVGRDNQQVLHSSFSLFFLFSSKTACVANLERLSDSKQIFYNRLKMILEDTKIKICK